MLKLRDNLDRLMRAAGHDTVSLSKASGVNQAYISELRRGVKTNPGLRVLTALAAQLECSIADLTGNDSLAGIDDKSAMSVPPSRREAELLKAYKALGDEDWRRRAVDALLLGNDND